MLARHVIDALTLGVDVALDLAVARRVIVGHESFAPAPPATLSGMTFSQIRCDRSVGLLRHVGQAEAARIVGHDAGVGIALQSSRAVEGVDVAERRDFA